MVKNNTPESLTVEFLERIKGEFFKKFSSDVISKAFSFGLNNKFKKILKSTISTFNGRFD